MLVWPKHVPVGAYEQPVVQLDLHATALAAAGVKADESWKLDGADLVRCSQEHVAAAHDALYWRFATTYSPRRLETGALRRQCGHQ
ncbi:MAG: hypothetical protein U0892_12335 [Pirellulales bacterium]